MVVFYLAQELNLSLSHTSMQALWGRGHSQDEDVVLAFPQTYMNLSGQAVQALAHYFKIPLDQILIITDDLNLSVGRMRFRAEGSAGGHNGLKSIIECLGTPQFPRLRVGVGQTPPGWDTADYVLSKFNQDEQPMLNESIKKAAQGVRTWIHQGLEAAMRACN